MLNLSYAIDCIEVSVSIHLLMYLYMYYTFTWFEKLSLCVPFQKPVKQYSDIPRQINQINSLMIAFATYQYLFSIILVLWLYMHSVHIGISKSIQTDTYKCIMHLYIISSSLCIIPNSMVSSVSHPPPIVYITRAFSCVRTSIIFSKWKIHPN